MGTTPNPTQALDEAPPARVFNLTEQALLEVFVSGYCSAIGKLMVESGMPASLAEAIARQNATRMIESPLNRDTILEQTTARLPRHTCEEK
ncbi:hypothetical protein K0651_01970 [Ornithinimicrobium sp. Arc0846-15]|nr:hypothetical protein [Ornithinimicrobium laminariae]